MSGKVTKAKLRPGKKRMRDIGYEEKVQLIKQVHARPILWDLSDKKHFDAASLKTAWTSVASELDKDVPQCKAAWKSLRDSYRYFCKTRRQNGRNNETGKWRLATHMSFLPAMIGVRGGRVNSTSFNPVEREDSESTPDVENECDDEVSIRESDISSLIGVGDVKDLEEDKDLSNWTEDLYSSVEKIRVNKVKGSPSKEEVHSRHHNIGYSRPIFAYWESILNKMPPEDADAAEQQMTQALWAENAAIKYKNSSA